MTFLTKGLLPNAKIDLEIKIMHFHLTNAEIASLNGVITSQFPKYTSQLINWANQNAQGTRPNVVGKMSELFNQFLNTTSEVSHENWSDWYLETHPNAVVMATDKINAQMDNLKKAITLIDRQMIEAWVRDLLLNKTFNGLYIQDAILKALAQKTGQIQAYRRATPEEESRGIDGFIGMVSYSVKPDTYQTMNRLQENLQADEIIYYKKNSAGITVYSKE